MRVRLLSCLLLIACFSIPASADLFMVTTADGPSFASPDEAAAILEKGILPMFDTLKQLKA